MFFDVNRHNLANFPCQYRLGELVVNTDPGWTYNQIGRFQIVSKGYVDHGSLADRLEEIIAQDLPSITGNFCVIVYDEAAQRFRVCSDPCRSFPMYWTDGTSINNLVPCSRTVWTNNLITWTNDLDITVSSFDLIGSSLLPRTTWIEIYDFLLEKFSLYRDSHPDPVKVFLSGGVDTLLVFSFILRVGIPYQMVWSAHVDFDPFWLMNHDRIEQHEFYRQIHHWISSSVLASGAPGDEFMLRSPTTANLYLLNQGTEILDQLRPCDLHYDYFSRPKHLEIFRQQKESFEPIPDLNSHLLNILTNDWQHWHIGNTLTWTPLRDLDMVKMILGLDFEEAVSQITRSNTSIRMIEKNCRGLSRLISDKKNSGNAMSNLTLFDEILTKMPRAL
jgi:hypothetical protein